MHVLHTVCGDLGELSSCSTSVLVREVDAVFDTVLEGLVQHSDPLEPLSAMHVRC